MSAGGLGLPPARRMASAAREVAMAHPWIWSYLAAAVLWVAIGVITGRDLIGTMTSAISLAPFLVLVGLGQMFVITAGSGNIDLSVQYNIPLAGFVALEVASRGSLTLGILAGLGVGVAIAVANLAAILILSIPPIVATLAVGLLAYSAASVRSGSYSGAIPAILHSFTVDRVASVSILAVACVAAAGVAAFVLHRTTYGRSLQAVGQNRRAAALAGVPVRRVIVISYLLCGLLAAVAGILLAAYTSPSVDLGTPYLLNSIAVVVLGGTLISGGRSSVAGVWGGALFLLLLVTLLNTSNISIATQDIVQGILIVAVLALVGTRKRT
jgi:ribose transport system permease protein